MHQFVLSEKNELRQYFRENRIQPIASEKPYPKWKKKPEADHRKQPMMKAEEKNNDEKQMMRYLSREMSEEELHAFEASSMNDPFLSDAMEGLMDLSSHQTEVLVGDLKNSLSKQIEKKKSRRRKPFFQSQFVFYIALAMVVIIILMVYFMITKLKS